MIRKLNIWSALLIFSLVTGGLTASLPKETQRCKLSDPSLTTCLTKSARKFLPLLAKGMPEIGLSSFDPLKIPDIHNNDTVLNFHLTNNRIFGPTRSDIEELKINQSKKKITLSFSIDSGRMDSDYTANGRLLILPITGEGESHIIMSVKYIFKLYYEVVQGKDGKNYWKIIKNKVAFTPTYMNVDLSNLFNGNKELAQTVLKFGNENWMEIFDIFGKHTLIKFTDTVVKEITNLFLKVPVDQMFEP